MVKRHLLLVPSDTAGCGFYRMIQPGRKLGDYPDYDVLIHMQPEVSDVDAADILIVQRTRVYRNKETGEIADRNRPLVERALERNIPIVYETDDLDAALPKHHSMYNLYQKNDIAGHIKWMLQHASALTTTTQYLASKLQEQVPNPPPAYVFPNCLLLEDPQWRYPQVPVTNRVRIGWAGGSSHLRDLLLFTGVAERLYYTYKDKVEFVLGGFDPRGLIIYYDDDGQEVERPAEPHETIWHHMAQNFFGNTPLAVQRKLKTLPIEMYGWHYSQIDIGIAPLEDTLFTRCKSPLKLLEYGAYGVPVIASEVQPYRDTLSHTLAGSLINTAGNGKDTLTAWMTAIRRLIDDPIERHVVGNNLHELVRDRFSIVKQVTQRRELIEKLIQSS